MNYLIYNYKYTSKRYGLVGTSIAVSVVNE